MSAQYFEIYRRNLKTHETVLIVKDENNILIVLEILKV